jgi:hypothetical protein
MLGQMKWKVQLNILHPKRLSRRSFHCHNSKFSIILTYFIVLQSASCTWCRRKLLKSFSILFSYLLCAMICTYASHKLYRLNLIWYNCSTLHPSLFILKNLNFIDAYLGLQFYCLIAEFSVIIWSTLLNTPVLEHIQPWIYTLLHRGCMNYGVNIMAVVVTETLNMQHLLFLDFNLVRILLFLLCSAALCSMAIE